MYLVSQTESTQSLLRSFRNFPIALLFTLVGIAGSSSVYGSEKAFSFEDESELVGPSTLLPDWHDAMLRADREHELIENCVEAEENCTKQTKPLRRLILRGRTLSPKKQLTLINHYINRKRSYHRDKRSFLEFDDYRLLKRQQWSTLLEFLDRGGDCEDYATSKYALLKLLGFDPTNLRIMIVYDRKAREHHALVAVYDSDLGTQLLDNDNKMYRKRPFSYRYVYSLNEDSIWDHSLDKERKPRRLPIKASR